MLNRVVNKIISGGRYALEGVGYLLRDPSWQIELVVLIIASIFLYFSDLSLNSKLWMFFSIWLVLIVEALNTAIETAIDYISLEKHPLAKKAKDVASAAVLMAILHAALVWAVMLLFHL